MYVESKNVLSRTTFQRDEKSKVTRKKSAKVSKGIQTFRALPFISHCHWIFVVEHTHVGRWWVEEGRRELACRLKIMVVI